MAMTVLLADLPRLLDDIVSGALEDESIHVARNLQTDGDLAAAALAANADIVVVAREGPTDLASIVPQLASLAGRSLLVLTPSGDNAWLYHCRCEAAQLHDISIKSLRDTVRKCSTTGDPA